MTRPANDRKVNSPICALANNPEPSFSNTRVEISAPLVDKSVSPCKCGRSPIVCNCDTLTEESISFTTTDDLANCFRFDWYQCTVLSQRTAKGGFKKPKDMAEDLRNQREEQAAALEMTNVLRLMGLYATQNTGKCPGNYRSSIAFRASLADADHVAILGHAGNLLMPHVIFPGANGACHNLVEGFRKFGIPHNVSRCDVRLDISCEGLMDELISRFYDKEEHTLISSTGRTFYYGSRKSDSFIRIYEKDLERVANGKMNREDADPNLVRIEMQVKPSVERKQAFSVMSAGEVARSKPMMRKLLNAVGEVLSLEGKAEIFVARKVEMDRDVRSTAQHGHQQYAKTHVRAAIADLADEALEAERAADRTDTDAIQAMFNQHGANLDERVLDRVIENTRSYMRENHVVSVVLEESGILEDYDFEEVTRRMVQLSRINSAERLMQKCRGLAAKIELLVQTGNASVTATVRDELSRLYGEVGRLETFAAEKGQSIDEMLGLPHSFADYLDPKSPVYAALRPSEVSFRPTGADEELDDLRGKLLEADRAVHSGDREAVQAIVLDLKVNRDRFAALREEYGDRLEHQLLIKRPLADYLDEESELYAALAIPQAFPDLDALLEDHFLKEAC